MFVRVVAIMVVAILPTAARINADCATPKCCEVDCCGPSTSWDANTSYCVPSPNSGGFNGVYPDDFPAACSYRNCCERDCCGTGTYYDISDHSCHPWKRSNVPDNVEWIQELPTPGFLPNVCGATLEDAVGICRDMQTCDKVKDGTPRVDCYLPCNFFDPSSCPDGQDCFVFVRGCLDFELFPNFLDSTISP